MITTGLIEWVVHVLWWELTVHLGSTDDIAVKSHDGELMSVVNTVDVNMNSTTGRNINIDLRVCKDPRGILELIDHCFVEDR